MRRYTLIFVGCWLSAALLSAACATTSDPQSITEISLRNGGGQRTYWYQFTLRSDGTAEYVGDVSPERRGEERDEKTFDVGAARVRYRGRVSAEQFGGLARLIIRNNFRSMPETFPGYLDAPMTTTSVVFAGERKEVSDQRGVKGEGLAEINRGIEQVAGQITWEREIK